MLLLTHQEKRDESYRKGMRMTVYVDALFPAVPSKRWPYKQACHMTCSGNIEELHTFARKLGLKRAYFQGQHMNLAFWHYDLTANKRVQAIHLGAISIIRKQRAEQVGLIKTPRNSSDLSLVESTIRSEEP